MKKVKFNQLDRGLRTFLARLVKSKHVILEDNTGNAYDLRVSKLSTPNQPSRTKVHLPSWPGRITGNLRRTDIYDDLH